MGKVRIPDRPHNREGPYRIFWTWLPQRRQQLSFSNNYRLYTISQKFAVDCAHRRFASHYIDSTVPMERKRNVDLKTVKWTGLKKSPAVTRAVCGEK
jgi:hypothetical protein